MHISFLLISCSTGDQMGTKFIFRLNLNNGVSSLDPAFARTQDNIWAVNQIFNGLIRLDSHLNPLPDLARKWEITDSGKLYTFTLKKEIFFHEHSVFGNKKTRKVNASDVVFSYTRLIDPATASPGAWIFRNRVIEGGFKAINDSTLQIRLTEPFAPFLMLLANPYCYIVPKEAVRQYGKDFGRNPVGTGPFVFKVWEDGIRLILLRNSSYFRSDDNGLPLPYADAVSISFIPSKQSEFMEFMQGNLDVFNGIESSFKDQIIDRNGTIKPGIAQRFSLERNEFLNTEYLSILVDSTAPGWVKSPLSKAEFRKSLSLSIDREQMIRYLRNGIGIWDTRGFCPPSLREDILDHRGTFNVTEARNLLKASGYSGEELSIFTTADYLDMMVFIQGQWQALGVNVQIEVVPSSVLKEQKSKGQLMMFRSSWIADYPDSENYFSCFYSANKAPNGPNYSRYSNPEFDQRYKELVENTDAQRHYELTLQMEHILKKDMPYIPLYYDESVRLFPKTLTGLNNNPLNYLFLEKVRHQRS